MVRECAVITVPDQVYILHGSRPDGRPFLEERIDRCLMTIFQDLNVTFCQKFFKQATFTIFMAGGTIPENVFLDSVVNSSSNNDSQIKIIPSVLQSAELRRGRLVAKQQVKLNLRLPIVS